MTILVGQLNVFRCVFLRNTARIGGAIFLCPGGSLRVWESIFIDNVGKLGYEPNLDDQGGGAVLVVSNMKDYLGTIGMAHITATPTVQMTDVTIRHSCSHPTNRNPPLQNPPPIEFDGLMPPDTEYLFRNVIVTTTNCADEVTGVIAEGKLVGRGITVVAPGNPLTQDSLATCSTGS